MDNKTVKKLIDKIKSTKKNKLNINANIPKELVILMEHVRNNRKPALNRTQELEYLIRSHPDYKDILNLIEKDLKSENKNE